MQPLISLEDVTVLRSGATILANVSWQVMPDQRWVVIGPNGAGKTTLLSILSSYLFPTTGTAEILGSRLGRVDTGELKTRIGVASSSTLDLIPSDEKVSDLILSSAYAVFGRWIEEYDLWDESRSSALLHAFGIKELASRNFGTLSEGERKRVMIARALMPDPELLLLDEPAAGLDLGGREDLLRRLSAFALDPGSPATVMVTHHLEEIPSSTTHILILKAGSVFAQGEIGIVLTSESLSALYESEILLETRGGRYFAHAR